jgi:hypothetical protein
MRLSTFDREDPNPFLTTPPDRTATPRDRRATHQYQSQKPNQVCNFIGLL